MHAPSSHGCRVAALAHEFTSGHGNTTAPPGTRGVPHLNQLRCEQTEASGRARQPLPWAHMKQHNMEHSRQLQDNTSAASTGRQRKAVQPIPMLVPVHIATYNLLWTHLAQLASRFTQAWAAGHPQWQMQETGSGTVGVLTTVGSRHGAHRAGGPASSSLGHRHRCSTRALRRPPPTSIPGMHQSAAVAARHQNAIATSSLF